jgi:uncharacterized protein YggE
MHKQCSFLGLFALLGVAACAHPHSLVMSPSAPEGVRVHGVGEAAGAPDVARTQLGVDVQAATAEQASAEATQRMAALTAALKQLGIAEKDLRTSQYSLSFEPERSAPPIPAAPPPAAAGSKQPTAAAAAPPAPKGHYRVLNTLDVTIRDMSLIGRVLQLAGDSDGNTAYGITYDLENDEALLIKARQRAVAEAQASAKELAKLTGVELGEVIAVTEEQPNADDDQPVSYSMAGAGGDNHAAAASVPIEEGEIKVHYGVQLVYAVRRK